MLGCALLSPPLVALPDGPQLKKETSKLSLAMCRSADNTDSIFFRFAGWPLWGLCVPSPWRFIDIL